MNARVVAAARNKAVDMEQQGHAPTFVARRGDQSDHYDREQAWQYLLEKIFQEPRH